MTGRSASSPPDNPLPRALLSLLRRQCRRSTAEQATQAIAAGMGAALTQGPKAWLAQAPENPLLQAMTIAVTDPGAIGPMVRETATLALAAALQAASAPNPAESPPKQPTANRPHERD